jgi:predicted PurR-regulated permease PerM
MKKSRLLPVFVIVIALGTLLYLLKPILTPFLISFLIAYILSPVVLKLTKWHVPRTLAVVVVFVALISVVTLALVVLIPVIQRQVMAFTLKVPGYIDVAYNVIAPWLTAVVSDAGVNIDLDTLKQQVLEHWQEFGKRLGQLVGYIAQSGLRLAGWLVNLVLIPVVTFYLLRDWDVVIERGRQLLPPQARNRLTRLIVETDSVLASFMRGQLAVMLVLAAVYSTGLWLVGIDLALPIGLLAGLVSFVPYLGFIIGILLAGVAALLQFQDSMVLLWVAGVFGIGQLLESMLLTPYLVGDRIGLHPVAVIFAVMAGGQLFGFFGILLALPMAAAGLVWARHLHEAYHRRPRRRPKGTKKRIPSPS